MLNTVTVFTLARTTGVPLARHPRRPRPGPAGEASTALPGAAQVWARKPETHPAILDMLIPMMRNYTVRAAGPIENSPHEDYEIHTDEGRTINVPSPVGRHLIASLTARPTLALELDDEPEHDGTHRLNRWGVHGDDIDPWWHKQDDGREWRFE
ncbi:hypothetical protein AB1207_22445 [Kineococcus endophyticus]|uniref:Uncharacterized protein n=1 Tax=Kineococcus endophyticus TaxID=1181883 RepID=A0ABV3PD06_9ACTN